jgi:hypothetical protein
MDNNPDFLHSLKLNNAKDFEFFGYLSITHPENPLLCEDEILGFFYIDIKNCKHGTTPLFKQDYVVNVKKQNKTYISYTADKIAGKTKNAFVQPLLNFFDLYGCKNIYYSKEGVKWWHHHYNDVTDLPDSPPPNKELLRQIGNKLKIKHKT